VAAEIDFHGGISPDCASFVVDEPMSLRKSLTRKFWLVGDGGTITEVRVCDTDHGEVRGKRRTQFTPSSNRLSSAAVRVAGTELGEMTQSQQQQKLSGGFRSGGRRLFRRIGT
jgi:hypothetical protein